MSSFAVAQQCVQGARPSSGYIRDLIVQAHLVIPMRSKPSAPLVRSSTKAFVCNTPSSVTCKRTLQLAIKTDKNKGRGKFSIAYTLT